MRDDSNAKSIDRTGKPVTLSSTWPGWFLLFDAIFSIMQLIGPALPVPVAILLDMLYMELGWLPFLWSPISVVAFGVMLCHRKYGAMAGFLVGAVTIFCVGAYSIRAVDRILTYPGGSPVIEITQFLLGSALRIAWNVAYLFAVRRFGRQNDVSPKGA